MKDMDSQLGNIYGLMFYIMTDGKGQVLPLLLNDVITWVEILTLLQLQQLRASNAV